MAGDIDAEITILEQTVKAQPSNADARMALDIYYPEARRGMKIAMEKKQMTKP